MMLRAMFINKENVFRDIARLVMDGNNKRYAVDMIGDLNLYLNEGDRGRITQFFCTEFSMDITNGTTRCDDPNHGLSKHRGVI